MLVDVRACVAMPSDGGVMGNKHGIELVTDQAEWDKLFSQVEQPHISQAWAYGQAVQETVDFATRRLLDAGGWRARRVVFIRGGAPVAICQLLDKSLAGLRFVSLADRGPLFLDAEPTDDTVRDVYRALRQATHLRGLLILVPALPDSPHNVALLGELGFRPRPAEGFRSTRVDLTPDEEEMRKKLKSKWRNQLKSGERSGAVMTASTSPEAVEWMIERHVENMKDKGFTEPTPAFVRALYNAAPDDFVVCQAVVDGKSLAGMAAFTFGQAAEYYIGWVSDAGRKLNVNNFLFWQAGLELRRRGCRTFDLGGMRAGSTEGFKTGMGGSEDQLVHNWLSF